MSRKPKFDPGIHDENPEWTAEDFAKSRPASEMPADMLAQFKNGRGRPRLAIPKEGVKIRLDAEVMSALRAGGPGWQTRINDLLRSKIRGGKIVMSPAKPAAKGKTVVAATKVRSI
jgi:uncharacterized protein (DUF4415 family)